MVQRIKSILASLDNLKEWEPVQFPSPLHSNLDYVYTIDVDAGTLAISRWEKVDGVSQPFPRQMQLSCLDETEGIDLYSLPEAKREIPEPEEENPSAIPEIALEALDLYPGPPTALNELQFQLCRNFCFIWRHFIDDPTTWRYPSMGFNTIAIGLLRIAAWDLEVSSDTEIDYPANGINYPRWEAPKTDIFWFHGYLVLLRKDVNTKGSIWTAISKARHFLGGSRQDPIRLIILSFQHIAFVELSSKSVSCSRILPLIVNTSVLQCSPGFRLLCYILSSYCWKPSLAGREHLGVGLPLEIQYLVLGFCAPKSALALSQSSFIFEERYYTTIPQIQDLLPRNFNNSVICCGKKDGLQDGYIYCPRCYTFKHAKCVGLKSGRRENPEVICSDCQDEKLCTKIIPGGINRTTRRDPGPDFEVSVAGSPKTLRLRLSKPSHLRPELRLLGNLVTVPPRLIAFTIRFNGSFSGLVYGLDDDGTS